MRSYPAAHPHTLRQIRTITLLRRIRTITLLRQIRTITLLRRIRTITLLRQIRTITNPTCPQDPIRRSDRP